LILLLTLSHIPKQFPPVFIIKKTLNFAMAQHSSLNNGIPISVSLNPTLEAEHIRPQKTQDKKRLLIISAMAVLIAGLISFIAKFLVYLIDLVTNVSFYGRFSLVHSSPANNHLGLFVILVPAIGGIIVGLMALYGSKAIRGHGIPEAMEQILTNQSKIKPAITYLKPLSSAISIGTGGPFGAEGPIIATGGALGSTIGQLMKITHNERKILLAAGATAGMSAIFGSPIAAIFLAIELLLFEFSPRSIIPVALACITGAAGHHLLFDSGPVFAMKEIIAVPANAALAGYSIMGLLIGILSVLVTKVVYLIEDGFEKLPLHWMWWPAIGGLAVGLVGYFAPRTLGVGYDNITDILSGSLSIQIVLSLCLLKFVSWAIALGSGTSGGTLAPLLTIGGATGMLFGSLILWVFPASGITLPLAALIGMSAMFAGASRALLTSIVFAIETTSQPNALLPLLAACTGSYLISFLLMKNTIMTEKIARRGVVTPHSYEPDMLEKIKVGDVVKDAGLILSEDNSIDEVRSWLEKEKGDRANYFIITNTEGEYKGIISSSSLFSHHHDPDLQVGSLIKRESVSIFMTDNLRSAVEMMSVENIDVLPVLSYRSNTIIGILSYHDIIAVYKQGIDEHKEKQTSISLKRNGLKILLHGQRLMTAMKKK
jgi:CIC family chloride channel protein